jgi:hypothetical protein
VPPNGYLSDSGQDWECDRNYERRGDLCVSLEVPANAHVSSSGHDWDCDAGYRLYRGTCMVSDE